MKHNHITQFSTSREFSNYLWVLNQKKNFQVQTFQRNMFCNQKAQLVTMYSMFMSLHSLSGGPLLSWNDCNVKANDGFRCERSLFISSFNPRPQQIHWNPACFEPAVSFVISPKVLNWKWRQKVIPFSIFDHSKFSRVEMFNFNPVKLKYFPPKTKVNIFLCWSTRCLARLLLLRILWQEREFDQFKLAPLKLPDKRESIWSI